LEADEENSAANELMRRLAKKPPEARTPKKRQNVGLQGLAGQWAIVRAIVRFSLNHDHGSALRNVLNPVLVNAGLARISTGTYEGDVAEAALRNALAQFWNAMSNHLGPAHLDHFWMYIDNPPAPAQPAPEDD
jgi:hypothetical protein